MPAGEVRRGGGAAALVAVLVLGCTADQPPEPDDGISTDVGVTAEACPDAVDGDHGCIYLGVLADLTVGPFAATGVETVEGQRAFWGRVNQQGGIAGYEVDIDSYTRDHRFDVDEQAERFAEVEPEVLALALTMGTATTLAILDDLDEADVVATPGSWWSGWDDPSFGRGVLLGSGSSYCVGIQVGLDRVAEDQGEPVSVLAVGFPDDYGEDVAAGTAIWAETNGVEYVGLVEVARSGGAGDGDEEDDGVGADPIGEILGAEPDVITLAVGPAETGQIVGGAAAQGYQGSVVGAAPTWSPALLDTDAAAALEALYLNVAPWEGVGGQSAAHAAMDDALDGVEASDGFAYGWIWSYPMLAALEAAAEQGDLTRSGLRAVVDGLEVDYEGALDERTFGPDAEPARTAVLSRPDADAPLGLDTVATDVTGPTADAGGAQACWAGADDLDTDPDGDLDEGLDDEGP